MDKTESTDWTQDWLKKQEIGFKCGPKPLCINGKKHDFSKWEHSGLTGTAVCSVCGHRAIDDAGWL